MKRATTFGTDSVYRVAPPTRGSDSYERDETNELTNVSKTSRDISPSDTCARVRDFDEFRKRPNRIARQHRAGGKRMTPVLQTHLGGPEGHVVGNCMQAAIASLLDLDLGDVPHFMQYAADPWEAFGQWLTRRGLRVEEVASSHPGYLLALGPTRGGTHHWVIYRDGELAHDPAGGEGLFYAERFYAISQTEPLCTCPVAEPLGLQIHMPGCGDAGWTEEDA